MTQRRAWALLALAGCALAACPWAPVAAAVGCCALAALTGISALAARDTLREGRVAALEEQAKDHQRRLMAAESKLR